MDWDDLKYALAVARHGSLSAAARALGTSQPTVGRRLDGFERRIGVKLFERGRDGLIPTALGAALIDGLARMEEGALAVERRLASRDTGLQGRITVTSLDWLNDHLVAPMVAEFGVRHPLVSVELLNHTRLFSLSRREADIAIRFGGFEQEDVVLRKVAEAAYGLYAAPAYLDRHGPPDFGRGCEGHAIVLLHEEAGRVLYRDWMLELAPKARVAFTTNGVLSHVAAVEAGRVMAALPRVVADRRPGLVHIGTPLPEPVQPIRLGVHADLRDTPRIRAFIDHAAECFKARTTELRPG